MHTPVLLDKVLGVLEAREGGRYIDATAGGGGYIKSLLEKEASILAIDWDEDQIKNLGLRFKNKENLTLVVGNFAQIERIVKENGFFSVDGVIFDLGLSMSQLKEGGRGFSYKRLGEPLDMRINKSLTISAEDLINTLSEKELYEIFAKNAEEINSRTVARAIVRARHLKRVKKVSDMTEIIDGVLGRKDERVYARIFQAIRMTVNNELENLREGLKGALMVLKEGGKMVVVTFHSVEDRLVKRFIQQYSEKIKEHSMIQSGKKYSFERSAKLRIIVKK